MDNYIKAYFTPGVKDTIHIHCYTTLQSQKAVSVYLKSKQTLPSGFAQQFRDLYIYIKNIYDNMINEKHVLRTEHAIIWHTKLTQCWFNVGPPSSTLAQQ